MCPKIYLELYYGDMQIARNHVDYYVMVNYIKQSDPMGNIMWFSNLCIKRPLLDKNQHVLKINTH